MTLPPDILPDNLHLAQLWLLGLIPDQIQIVTSPPHLVFRRLFSAIHRNHSTLTALRSVMISMLFVYLANREESGFAPLALSRFD
jgi:hypothetical protein